MWVPRLPAGAVELCDGRLVPLQLDTPSSSWTKPVPAGSNRPQQGVAEPQLGRETLGKACKNGEKILQRKRGEKQVREAALTPPRCERGREEVLQAPEHRFPCGLWKRP